jgi:hypothetical protein
LNGPHGGDIQDLAYHSPTATVYAATNRGVFRSNDNGLNWSHVQAGTNYWDHVPDIEIDASGNIYFLNYSGFYASTDGGTSFTKFNLPSPPANGFSDYRNVAKAPNGTLYISVRDYDFNTSQYTYKVYRSADGGANWLQAYTTTATSNYYWRQIGIAVNPVNNQVFLGTPFSGVLRSSDNGVTWTATTGLPAPTGNNAIYSISVNSGGTAFCIVSESSNALYSFNGSSWVQNTAIGSLKTYFSDSDRLVPFGSTGFYVVDNYSASIRYTGNNGTGWSTVGPSHPGGLNVLAPLGSTAVLMAGNYIGIRFSADSGLTWASRVTGMEATYGYDFLIPNGTNRLLASANNGLALSTDGGSTWARVSEIYTPVMIKLSDGTLIGSQSDRSLDNGSTWSGNVPYLYDMATGDNNIVYGIGYNSGYKFYRSPDKGVTWTEIVVTGLPASFDVYSYRKKVLDVSSANTVYFVIYNNGTGRRELWKFQDLTNVATKITVTGADDVLKIQEYGGTLYATGYATGTGNLELFVSSNGGSTWTVKAIPSDEVIHVAGNGYLFNGWSGNFHYSKDQGTTWVQQDIFDEAYFTVWGVDIRSDGYAFVFADGIGTFRSSSPILEPTTAPVAQIIGYTSSQVDLRWTYTAGAVPPTEFVILRSGDAGVTFDTVSVVTYNVGQTTYIYEDYSASPSSSYIYKVAAANAAGYKMSSNVNVTTLADCSSTIPTNRSWTATGGAVTSTQIVIQRTSDAQYGQFYVSDITASASPYSWYFIEECNATMMYYSGTYWPDGNGTWNGSNIITLKYTDGVTPRTVTYTLNAVDPVPPIPSSPELYVANGSTIILRFYGNYWETSFDVQRATVLAGPYTTVGNVLWTQDGYNNGFQYVDQLASPIIGQSYYYRIVAKNSSGSSSPSGSSSIVLTNPPFAGLQNALWNTERGSWGVYYGDFDEDGYEDLAVPYYNSVNSPQVFKNNNGTSLTSMYQSLNITTQSDAGYFRGAVVADFNNDANLDLFVAEPFSSQTNWFLTGNGSGSFTRITGNPILDVQGYNGISAADFNNDGRLDLYFNAIYDDITSTLSNKLYQNNGSNNFSPVGTGPAGDPDYSTRVSVWSDYDNDNDQDLFLGLSGNGIANRLYRNDGGGVFTLVTGTQLDADTDRSSTRTASWGDYNNDSYLDLFVGNSGSFQDWIYKNDGAGGFIKITVPELDANPSYRSTYASAWGDLDNDGRLDLVTLGGVGITILHNDGGDNFTQFTTLPTELYAVPRYSSGLALTDVNNDGLLDITISEYYGYPNGIFINSGSWYAGAAGNKWVKVRLRGSVSNNAAVGALVEVKRAGYSAYRELAAPTGGYGQSSLTLHFGLGTATLLDEVKVYWPSGLTTTLTNQNTNQLIDIFEDGTPPVITHSSSNRDNGANYTVTATVTDSSPLSDVYVAWKGIRELDDVSNYEGATMVQGAGNTWTYAVPSGKYDEIGIEYYIGATDAAGNFDEVGPYFSRTRYPGENDLELSGLRSGGRADTWKLIGIPYDLSNKTVSSVFDELGPYDKNVWRMVTYKDQTSWQEMSGTTLLERGKGYFLNMVNATAVKFGNATTPNNDLNNEHRIAVKSGWNMISNPYPFNLNWDDVLCYNGISSGMDLQSYNGGYIPASSLGIFDGGLFFSSAGSAIDFPLTLAGTGCRIERVNSSDLSQTAWKLRLHIKNSSVQYGLGGIGMHPEASIDEDRFDQFTPPRFDDYLEMSTDHMTGSGERITLDFAPTSDTYVWSFSVDAATEDATEMTWNHLELGENTIPLYLYDKTSQKVVDMRAQGSYSFVMGKSRSFEIHFGKEVVPDRVVLGEAWPNPTNASATIPFALPESSAGGYQVAVEVYNTLGVRVKLVGEGLFQAGFHEMTWDGQDSNSEAVKPGMYLYRLKVSQNGETQTITSRIIRK